MRAGRSQQGKGNEKSEPEARLNAAPPMLHVIDVESGGEPAARFHTSRESQDSPADTPRSRKRNSATGRVDVLAARLHRRQTPFFCIQTPNANRTGTTEKTPVT